MSDATQDLLAEMARFGLKPGAIEWGTPKPVRFAGPNDRGAKKDGWYKAFPARPDSPAGAKFGHWKELPDGVVWQHRNGSTVTYDPEAMARAHAEREAERAKMQDEAAAKANEQWERAKPLLASEHPYLVRKGVTSAEGLRILNGKLLIPMRSTEPGNPLRSLQSIAPDGEKRFTSGGQMEGTRFVIGQGSPKDVVYIVEGFATGWTVHQATGRAVVVAFNAGNLLAIARAVREKQKRATVVIAADFDRWSAVRRADELQPYNAGDAKGRAAAKEIEALFAAPSFRDLCPAGPLDAPHTDAGAHDKEACGQPHPTDWNDLHQREGLDAVRAQLARLDEEPAQGQKPPPPTSPATEIAPYTGSGDTPGVPNDPDSRTSEPPATWLDSATFRPLGYDRGTYYYLSKETGQVHVVTDNGHTKNKLLALANLQFWETFFPAGKKGGVQWDTATDALFRACHRMKVFRHNRLRGRGCWPVELDSGDTAHLLHLGDRLLPPGGREFVSPEDYIDPQGHIYERTERLEGPSRKRALPLEDAKRILETCQTPLWLEEASGLLLAGWITLAPLCGALQWRPHIWVLGNSGSGKTTLMEKLVVPLTGGMRKFIEGGSTEAGIRQKLAETGASDALPVMFDEAEKSDMRSDDRIQSILALMRSSSSSGEAEVTKGTVGGKHMSFQVRSMFCLSSIGGALRQEADKTRVSVLQLHGSGSAEADQRAAHWKRFEPMLQAISVETGRELVSRTLSWLRDGRLHQTISTFRSAAAVALSNARSGDQYGTLYAGAWTLMSDAPPTEAEAREMLGSVDLADYIVDQVPAGKRALQTLLQVRERIDTSSGPAQVTLGELVDGAANRIGSRISDVDADRALRQFGMRVDIRGGQLCLLLGTSSEWIERALKDTPYGDIHRVLRDLPGVVAGDKTRFLPGLVCRTTIVPLAAFDE